MQRIQQLFDLTGRTALVTGGAGRIGFACCQALAECGASVAIVDLEARPCVAAAERLQAWVPSTKAAGFAADISDLDAVHDLVARTLEKYGRLDILVHAAALTGESALRGYSVPFEQQSFEAWQAAMNTNLSSAFLLAREARTALQASTHASIINISSIYGLVGPDLSLYENTTMGNPAAYAATKGGLLQLTRHLATVLAPDIRVNAISPGGIERTQPDSFRARYVAKTPLGRMGREEDLKGAVAYLAGDASAYVTGHNLIVDGGWTAW